MLSQKIWLGTGPRGKGEWSDVESAEKVRGRAQLLGASRYPAL